MTLSAEKGVYSIGLRSEIEASVDKNDNVDNHQSQLVRRICSHVSLDQLISCTAYAVFYRTDDGRLWEGRSAPVAQSM